jgi:hypothetical protein
MKFLFSKEFVTIFGMGYYPLQTTPYLLTKNLMKHKGLSSLKGFTMMQFTGWVALHSHKPGDLAL